MFMYNGVPSRSRLRRRNPVSTELATPSSPSAAPALAKAAVRPRALWAMVEVRWAVAATVLFAAGAGAADGEEGVASSVDTGFLRRSLERDGTPLYMNICSCVAGGGTLRRWGTAREAVSYTHLTL